MNQLLLLFFLFSASCTQPQKPISELSKAGQFERLKEHIIATGKLMKVDVSDDPLIPKWVECHYLEEGAWKIAADNTNRMYALDALDNGRFGNILLENEQVFFEPDDIDQSVHRIAGQVQMTETVYELFILKLQEEEQLAH